MLELKAHAKVNLGLAVTAKRPDGFHALETLFARLELHDTVRLEPRDSGITLEVHSADLPDGPENLAYRAAERYLSSAEAAGGVHIELTKRMPVAAGLGGGSSDAAAVLRGLSTLYPADLDLLELGAGLGSDVPFFVLDVGAARATGRGELLEAVELPDLHLVLVNPGIHVSAGAAYGVLASLGRHLDLEAVLERLRKGQDPNDRNDLQAGVLELEPEIAAVLDALKQTSLKGVMMSGSGSTCFGLAEDAQAAATISAQLGQEHPRWWVRATRTV